MYYQKSSAPPTLFDVPKLVEAMLKAGGEEAASAAHTIYDLSDVAHKQNRVPMVCSGKYDVLVPLTKCLTHDNAAKLHFVCLALNNLSIPDENKRVMALERGSRTLIGNLCKVIAAGKKEAFLCCICLMNLSFLEPAMKLILQYSPKDPNQKKIASVLQKKVPPLENPRSLIRILQDLLAHAVRRTADFRWAFGLLSVLSKHPDNAQLIAQTAIPNVAIENLRISKVPPSEWMNNSLEDFSLFLILHISQEVSGEALEGALEVIQPIMNDGGVQGLKATMVCAFLEAPWSVFPNYGVSAAACVSELMGNCYEHMGKKGQYASNQFRLHTATKAFGDLARAAGKADATDAKDSHTKVVALPTAVALLFQIVADVAIHGEDEDELDEYTVDEKAAEYAVSAINALLPALLQHEEPRRPSQRAEAACNHLKQMLTSYARKATSNIPAKAKASEAAEHIDEVAGSALPILENSYDLWIQFNG
jgi:hypothetical protein